VNCGIVFSNANGKESVKALYSNVNSTQFCTQLQNASTGFRVVTIEHLMAAFYSAGIHNAMVEIDGPEIPILDGSSRAFSHAIRNAGVQEQNHKMPYLKILRPVKVFPPFSKLQCSIDNEFT